MFRTAARLLEPMANAEHGIVQSSAGPGMAELIGEQAGTQVGEFRGADRERPKQCFSIARCQREVVVEVIDCVAQVERESVLAVLGEQIGELRGSASADLDSSQGDHRDCGFGES